MLYARLVSPSFFIPLVSLVEVLVCVLLHCIVQLKLSLFGSFMFIVQFSVSGLFVD